MIGTLIIGGVAGWLTGQFTKGEGYGIILNVALGILGGWFGGWLFETIGFEQSGSLIARLITATVGAFVLVWAYKKFVAK